MRIPWLFGTVAAAVMLLLAEMAGAAPDTPAEGSWKTEFEAVCSNTDGALALTKAQLADFVSRCDRLKPLIEAEEEPARKIHLRRLKSCRDLFAYMLESAESAPGSVP